MHIKWALLICIWIEKKRYRVFSVSVRILQIQRYLISDSEVTHGWIHEKKMRQMYYDRSYLVVVVFNQHKINSCPCSWTGIANLSSHNEGAIPKITVYSIVCIWFIFLSNAYLMHQCEVSIPSQLVIVEDGNYYGILPIITQLVSWHSLIQVVNVGSHLCNISYKLDLSISCIFDKAMYVI